MIRAFHVLWTSIERHRVASIVALASFTALVVILNVNMQIEEDVTRLLPSAGPQKKYIGLLESPIAKELPILLMANGAGSADLTRFADGLAAGLEKTGLFARVRLPIDRKGELALGRLVFEHRIQLVDPDEIETLDRPAIRKRLLDLRNLLSLPSGMMMQEALFQDPLGLTQGIVEKWTQVIEGQTLGQSGILLSADRKAALLLTTPVSGPMRISEGEKILDAVSGLSGRLRKESPGLASITATAIGAHAWAVSSARTLKHDLFVVFPLSFLFVILLFWLRFRGFRPLIADVLIIGIGTATGLAAVSLVFGKVHGITLGFGAALVGVADDYVIHFLNANRTVDGKIAAQRILSPASLALATDLAAFGALATSTMPGLRQVALLASVGLLVSVALTLIFLPLLPVVPRHAGVSRCARWFGHTIAPSRTKKYLGFALFAGLFIAALVSLPSLSVDPDLRKLDAKFPDLEKAEVDLKREFGGLLGREAFLAEGSTIDDALDLSRKAIQTLSKDEKRIGVESFWSPAAILPSRDEQLKRRTTNAEALDRLLPEIELVGAELGFKKEAFGPFRKSIENESGKPSPITLSDLKGTPLESVLSRTLFASGGRFYALGFFSTNDRAARGRTLEALEKIPGVSRLSGREATEKTIGALALETLRFTAIGVSVMVLLLLLMYRRGRPTLTAFVPALGGCIASLVDHALSGIPLNIVTTASLLLILGLGVDYGIYVIETWSMDAEELRETAIGVLLSALTTLSSFGVLVICRNQALHEVGRTVSIGIFTSLFLALVVLPSLLPRPSPD